MTIKEKIQKGLLVRGMHVCLSDPISMEIAASLGYDFIWLDMEHTYMFPEHTYHHLLAAKASGTPVFVRVPQDDLTVTKKVLELGPDGIIFPMVKDAKHTKELLDMTLYPPYGKRGCGPMGAIRYGIDDLDEYTSKKFLNTCRFIQIEQKSAVDDIENIAALPYLDGCFLGMNDLSGSLNKLGQVFDDENVALAKKATQVLRKSGKSVGISTYDTRKETIKFYYDMGVNMLSFGCDYVHILDKSKETLETINSVIK